MEEGKWIVVYMDSPVCWTDFDTHETWSRGSSVMLGPIPRQSASSVV